jgi:hypothetical protein
MYKNPPLVHFGRNNTVANSDSGADSDRCPFSNAVFVDRDKAAAPAPGHGETAPRHVDIANNPD